MIDLHCDTLSLLYKEKNGSLKSNNFCVDLKKLKSAGAVAEFFACFVDMKQISENGYNYAIELINRAKWEIEENSGLIALARNYDDLVKNKSLGKISAFLTVEEGGIIGNNIEKLDFLYREGVRLVTVCWNYENSIGFPNSDNKAIMQKGLKSFGFEVVEKMNELGIIIDVSHLSDGGFWDVLKKSKTTVIASHSNARELCQTPRNLSDSMIKALAEKGGIAGVNFYPHFLSTGGKASAEAIADHIIYMCNIGGEDFVALGTDFDGFSDSLTDILHIGQIHRLFSVLKSHGFTERKIEKLKRGNAERILREVL